MLITAATGLDDHCYWAGGNMDLLEIPMLAGPAILWGILFSDCRGETPRSKQNEAADTEFSIQEESDTDESSESVGKSFAGPAILWGILVSEVGLAACEVLDANTIVNLWLAAGYDSQLPLLEDQAPTPSVIDAITTTDKASTRPPDPTGPYIIKASPGKGQGIFASRCVPAGSCILADKPFLLIPKPYNNLKVLSTFERMPLANRKLYMQLSCPDRSSFSANDIYTTDVMRIFEANCFNLGDHAAVFLNATRFNHSCLPNTYYSWSETRHEIVFHSMLDISQGEELTICYGRPFRTRLERRSELRIYDFCCRCPACDVSTAFGQASESRRLEMRALDEQIVMLQSQPKEALMSDKLQDPLTPILRLIELIKEEGLHGELMTPYRDAADCLKVRGKCEEALVFARLELEEEVRCLGLDSEVVCKTREYIGDLELVLVKEGAKATRQELKLDSITIDPSADTQELDNAATNLSQPQPTRFPHDGPPHLHSHSHSYPQQPTHYPLSIKQPEEALETKPSETEPHTPDADIEDAKSALENADHATIMPTESQASSPRLVRSRWVNFS